MNIRLRFLGINLFVEYDYQPEESMTLDYPGCPEYCEVTKITTEHGDDITSLFDTMADKIEDAILEAHRDKYYEEYDD